MMGNGFCHGFVRTSGCTANLLSDSRSRRFEHDREEEFFPVRIGTNCAWKRADRILHTLIPHCLG